MNENNYNNNHNNDYEIFIQILKNPTFVTMNTNLFILQT